MKLAHVSFQEASAHVNSGLDLSVAPASKPVEIKPLRMPKKASWTRRSENYLLDRGLSEQTINQFGLYYCQDGWYSGRIIIPVVERSKTVTFQARAIDSKVEPRYLSPKDSPKNRLWFNLDGYHPGKRVIIVEGPFDVMRLHELGIFAICPLGKSISQEQIKVLTNLHVHAIFLLQDQDATPNINRVWAQLSAHLTVRILLLQEASDPGEISGEEAETLLDKPHTTAASLQYQYLQAWRRKVS